MGFVPIFLLCFILILFVVTMVANNFISNLFSNRKFTISLGTFMLVIFIVGKYVWYLIDFINYFSNGIIPSDSMVSNLTSTTDIESLLYSNLLLLNLTDMMYFIISISLIFNGNKCFSKVFSLISLTVGIPLVIFSLLNDSTSNEYFETYPIWKYFLIGNGITRLSFIGFIFLIFSSTGIYISAKKYSRWSILSSYLIYAIIFMYLSLSVAYAKVWFNASGFAVYDWNVYVNESDGFVQLGIFSPLNNLLSNSLFNIAIRSIDTIRLMEVFMLFALNMVFIIAKNLLTKSKIKQITIYRPWYQNSFLFKDVFYRIDGYINSILYNYSKRSYLYGLDDKDFFMDYKNALNSKQFSINSNKDENKNQTKFNLLNKRKNSNKKNETNVTEIKLTNENVQSINNDFINDQKSFPVEQTNPNNQLNIVANQPYQDENGNWLYMDEVGQTYISNANGEWELKTN